MSLSAATALTSENAAVQTERIVDIDVADEMRGSFLEYAYSVIYSRALPDARDGLKPVQRRILYQMAQMGLSPERGHVKSARVVGEVMGRLHPHGDSAIYDALVRMAAPYALRLPLIDGHGNFGSLDDGPAAMRYTECRLAPAASTLTASLDENVVDFTANYDGREQEPVVLPASVPMLLINGAAGIAVGMATNMPPHNLGEVCAAAKAMIRKPRLTLDEAMEYVPGPDLPTGGQIVGLDGIRDAYATGKGSFRMRAATRVEQVSAKRKGIVVTALPYGVGPERLAEKLKELVIAKKIEGISDLTDLTDGDRGMHIVIEIKSGFSPEAVLEKLYRLTPLEESYNVNNVALVDGQPKTLGLIELLAVFVAHREDVIRRRSEYRKLKAETRLHMVDGLLIATLNIDEVVALIRASEDASVAKARLIDVFDLSDAQATFILDMPLRRLTKLAKIELEKEVAELNTTISELDKILSDPKVLKNLMIKEIDQAVALHDTPRRTVLVDGQIARTMAAEVPLEVPDEPCRVVLTAQGLIARTGGTAGGDADLSSNALRAFAPATTRGEVAVVTNLGRAHRLSVMELPMTSSGGHSAAGAPVKEYCSLDRGEKPIGLLPLAAPHEQVPQLLAVGTAGGVVKRVAHDVPTGKDSWEIIALKAGDRVVGAGCAVEEADLVFVTSDAQLLHFPASAVRPQGRSAGGMAGIKLGAGSAVVFFGPVGEDEGSVVVTIAGSLGQLEGTAASSVKISDWSQFPGKGRGTGGVRCHRFVKGEDALLLAWAGAAPVRAETSNGKSVALPDQLKARDGAGDKLSTTTITTLGGSHW